MKQIIPNRIAEIIYALVMIAFGLLHLKYGKGGGGVTFIYAR